MGYTFEVNMHFYVLSLTSLINPLSEVKHLMDYGNMMGKSRSVWWFKKG